MPKKKFTGKITSNKMQKTVVVAVEIHKKHPLYKKEIRNTRRFKARSEMELKIGDIVVIEETRPLAKDVSWKVTEKFDEKKGR